MLLHDEWLRTQSGRSNGPVLNDRQTMNPWWQLPNALLIDWVLESVKTNQDLWARAWDAAYYIDPHACRSTALDAGWYSKRNSALSMAWDASPLRDVYAVSSDAWDAATDAILALIVYDDCAQYLNMTYDQLLIYATLSERPQAVLLLPLKWIQEHEPLVTPA